MNQPNKSTATWTADEHRMMSLALQLARKGVYTARPNPCVGCVIVNDGVIVGEGWHQQFGQAHAEINALKQAGDKAQGATCYVTLEPCAHMGKTGPCANALVDAGIKQVIAAMGDPNPRVSGKGFDILRDAGIEVKVGLLEASAKLINKGFISRMQRNRPWVICKLAMSLDGRTALANGKSKWITGPAARADVQKLRARQDAIITGIGTVIADNPSLTVRAADTMEDDDPWITEANKNGFQQPKRVLLDPNQKASGQENVFNADTQVFWVTRRPIDSALDDHIVNWSATDALPALLEELVKVGCNSVLLEAGHTLAGSFLKAGLIDELVVYMAPKLMGSTAMGLVSLDLDCMQDIVDLELTDLRKVGNDIRMTYQVKSD